MCECPGCAAGLDPFTVDHFRAWTSEIVLDDDTLWVLDDFQAHFVGDLFDASPKTVGWLIVPEGNGKTTLVGGLALYYCEHVSNASIPVAASSRDQGNLVYRQAEGLVLRTERLYEVVESEILRRKGKRKLDTPRFDCLEGYRRINHVDGGRIQIFAADDNTGDGVIPVGLFIVDELHRHKNLNLYRTWRGKLDKQGAKGVVISTAGEPTSEFEETREKIRQAEGVEVEREPGFVRVKTRTILLHEYAVPEDGDTEDFGLVKRANPFSRITPETLAEKFHSEDMTTTHWRRFVCNIATRGVNAAITEGEWGRARTDEEIPEGERVWLGYDGAWKWDTLALVPLWVPRRELRLFGPVAIIEPPRDGTMTHPDVVKARAWEIHERNPIHTVVMDMTKSAEIAAWFVDELGAEVVDRAQGNAFQALDYERFTEALRHEWLKHPGDPGLTRHALNAVAQSLPNGKTRFARPSTSRAGSIDLQRRRWIDALVAAAMVHTTAAAEFDLEEEPPKEPLVAWA